MNGLIYDAQFHAEFKSLVDKYSAEHDPDICCCGGSISQRGHGCPATCYSEVDYRATCEAEENLRKRTQHPCSGKCPRFDKEQCKSCLVGDE